LTLLLLSPRPRFRTSSRQLIDNDLMWTCGQS
jgi:hypothetical protein